MRIIPKPAENTPMGGTYFLSGKTFSTDKAFASLIPTVEKRLDLRQGEGDVAFLVDEKIPPQGYNIEVNEEGVKVYASEKQGAFYGIITLQQYKKTGVPYGTIFDKPRFSYRGIMLDVARHFFDKEVVKETLEQMAYYKLNVFHWHLTDDQGWRVEIKKYPHLAEVGCVRKDESLNWLGKMKGEEYGRGCYFTQDDIREIVAFAAERFITVIPEIDMPGHLTSALALFPELSCEKKPLEVSPKWGVKDTVGCIGNPDFFAFTHDIIDEICDLFPSPYFHIGGDEVPRTKWKSCPACQALMQEKNLKKEGDLQGYFTRETVAYLASKGKRTIGWNEILRTNDIEENVIVQWWTGKDETLQWLSKGGETIVSPCKVCYLDYPYIATNLEKIYGLGPEAMGASPEQKGVLGIEAPLWTEVIYDKKKYDFQLYPRLQAVAEAGWTPLSRKNYKDFTERLASFLEELKEQGINFCPPEKYNPVGWKGLRQKWIVGRKFLREPNVEVNL